MVRKNILFKSPIKNWSNKPTNCKPDFKKILIVVAKKSGEGIKVSVNLIELSTFIPSVIFISPLMPDSKKSLDV
jgi:hypothetical protein